MILVGVIYLLYYLSIVQGYNITNYTWPLLAKFRSITESFLPNPGFIEVPLIRSMTLWFVDSINALLNYIPIFFILFGLIAILEDSGYMPRMAFILDRIFNKFGLHGQSTLPMVLGGVYVGGCAVPGVMSCKGIPDERARFATILTIPMLNCLAKVPLYVLLINIYFAEHKGLAMFFISTISLLMVLPVAKILTLTVLKDKDTAPFIMEMPPYHIPTIRGVLGRAVERVWLFIRKIITIVAAIAIIIFILLQITKMIVNTVGAPTDWDVEIGLPAEIVPLDKPYALWTGNVFRGIVKSAGKPVPFAEVEVEYMNHMPVMGKNAFTKEANAKAPQDAFVTMCIKADAAGEFAFGIPKAGWWGFAALGVGPDTQYDGKELSQDAVIWIKAVDMK